MVSGVSRDHRAKTLIEPADGKYRVHGAAPFSAATGARGRGAFPAVPVPDPERTDAARQEQDDAQQEDAEHQLPGVGEIEVRERTDQFQRHRGDEDGGDALVAGKHRDEDEFTRRGPVGELRIDVPLRHQGKGAAGAGENRGDHEVDRDDPVGRDTQIFDAQIVFTHGEAGEAEFGPEQDGGRDAGKAGHDDRDRIQHEIGLARIGETHAEQARPPDIESIGAAKRGGFHQRAVKHHRQRQRQHAEEDAAVARDQRTDHETEQAAADRADNHLRHRIGEAPGIGDQRHAIAAGGKEQALAERDIAGAGQHHDAERDQRVGRGDRRQRQGPGRQHAAEQRHRSDQRDHDERMQVLPHHIRLAVSRLNSPSGRNISTAAMIR